MVDSTSTFNTTSIANSINTKRKIKTNGATMYTKVEKAYETGVRYPVKVDAEIDMAYGEHDDDFLGYIVLQDRSKMSILKDS